MIHKVGGGGPSCGALQPQLTLPIGDEAAECIVSFASEREWE